MVSSLNIDVAAQFVNTIVNSVRCSICDATSGDRLRYACGHTICSSCDSVTSCLLCLTPPDSAAQPVRDGPLSSLAKNVCELLDIFQDTFHVNVAIQSRISAQRKLERELFPQCIQAPTVTYHNKKKSFNTRRSSIFTDNQDSGFHTMDKSSSYVYDWLEQNNEDLLKYQPPRTPFADIPVNSPNHKSTPIKTNINKSLKENTTKSYRKRSHFKTNITQSRLNNIINTSIKSDTPVWKSAKRLKQDSTTRSKDESGIVVDDDTIVIEDSQTEEIDKDRQALMAILEADKMAVSNNSITQRSIEDLNTELKITEPSTKKENFSPNVLNWMNTELEMDEIVKPGLHKESLKSPEVTKVNEILNSCKKCNETEKPKLKDVSIRIETNSLITTVTVTNDDQTRVRKVSKSTQTDISDIHDLINPKAELKNIPSKIPESKPMEVTKDNKTVISESDSEPEMSGSILVEALVHRVNDVERHVLSELSATENRTPRALKRGRTPASSDSSDKENRDPNRKKSRVDKKKKKKFHR